MRRLLCWFGRHAWSFKHVNDSLDDVGRVLTKNYFGTCSRCGTTNIFFSRIR